MTTLGATINGIPADLWIGRVYLGTFALIASTLTVWNLTTARTELRSLQFRLSRPLGWLTAVLLMWVALVEWYGALWPFGFPNPIWIRIALQWTLPIVVLWPPLKETIVVRRLTGRDRAR